MTFSGTALVYGHCDECEPVLYLRDAPAGSWDLVAVEPVLIETRADPRSELEKSGLDVLAEDDRRRRQRAQLQVWLPP